MAGRKTIMVDGGVWNKVEELKHNAFLRSSGDAIETAVDIVTSDKYYAGINAQKNDSDTLYYVVESLGRTEDEAVRNLLIFEQESVYGNLRAEDIPPADETDINEPGFFVVECTKELYHAGKLFDDPEGMGKKDWFTEIPRNQFSCVISETKNGALIADIQKTGGKTFYVLVDELKNEKIARIVDYGTSPIELHQELFVDYIDDNDEFTDLDEVYTSYNCCGYKILKCTPRLFAECVGNIFQSRDDIIMMDIIGEDFGAKYREYYGIIREEIDQEAGNKIHVVDTTPEGHYYALLTGKNGLYGVLNVGDTANKAGKVLAISSPVEIEDAVAGHFIYHSGDSNWNHFEENGERIGKYCGEDICLVECTVEVYAKYLMKKENEVVICTIEEVDGYKLAKFKQMKNISKETSEETTDKKSDDKKIPAKKTAGKETTKAKKTGGKK